MAIDRLVRKNGIDEKVYLENKNNLEAVKLNESDWELYQQYESAMAPVNNFITVTQTANCFVHMELFECASQVREGLQSFYFFMYENVSAKQGMKDLTKHELNQLVTTEDFPSRQTMSMLKLMQI